MIKSWMFENYSNVKRVVSTFSGNTITGIEEKNVMALNSYHIMNAPLYW